MMNSLVLINTGPGKGKTTAALGTAVRALGHGHKVAFIQFIKDQSTGESKFLEQYAAEKPEQLLYKRLGLGFIFGEIDQENKDKAEEALQLAKDLSQKDYDLIVLDEICIALKYELISINQVLDLIKNRSGGTSLILTGRDCPAEIIDAADTVTEMGLIKHAYEKGVAAKQGVEF